MEWVLQAVDELDDVIGALRHGWFGVHTQIAVSLQAAWSAVTARTRSQVV
jgi:hypothetical protein